MSGFLQHVLNYTRLIQSALRDGYGLCGDGNVIYSHYQCECIFFMTHLRQCGAGHIALWGEGWEANAVV